MAGTEPSSGASTSGEDEPAPRPGFFARVLRVLTGLFSLVVIALVAGTLALLGPYFRDDAALDLIVRAVALDWRDFGFERAIERFELERAAQSIGPQIDDEDCSMKKERDGTRIVSCAWGVVLNVPGGLDVPIRFDSRAVVEPDGSLR